MFRKCLFGYHPFAVHEAIEARDAALQARDAALIEVGERAEAAEARAWAQAAEVEAQRKAAETAEQRAQELEHVSARLAAMVVDRDKELRRIRMELQEAVERDDGGRRRWARSRRTWG